MLQFKTIIMNKYFCSSSYMSSFKVSAQIGGEQRREKPHLCPP
jgi:hypothetical protein